MSLGPGGKLLLVLAGLAIIAGTLHHYGFLPQLDPWLVKLGKKPPPAPPLSLGDFPPGAVAPSSGLNAMPSRPLKLAVPPRAAAAPLLWLAGGPGRHPEAPSTKAYALDLQLDVYADADAVRQALTLGADQGGVDAALVSVDDLGMRWPAYHAAAPRAVALVARSQGSVALAGAPGVGNLAGLRGKRLAVPRSGPERYFALFELARAGLSAHDVILGPESDSTRTAVALRESRADAAAGLTPEMSLAARDRAGAVLATSADSPYLLDLVLVVRGELVARYPEAVRRLVRGTLEANEAVRKNAIEAARLLDSAAPALGDPVQAIKDEPPATVAENLAFFGVSGDAPVHFDELLASAANLATKLGEAPSGLDPAEILESAPLRSIVANPAPMLGH
ncbi:MAG: ABC transporter substrate-binding protein [Deltaproteobacteria bacterium]|nr:ABC transporter substrate-binding protein [Deltaproteobacteria bacterium]